MTSEAAVPPALFGLCAEPVRWAVLCELARSDRQVDELVTALGRPQNLVSYHLAKLRQAGLVSARRSSHDGRDMFYRLNGARFAGLAQEALQSLGPHPVSRVGGAERGAPGKAESPANVLFLCTENSARSQMAEGLLRHLSGGSAVAASAGSRPGAVHPQAVRAMRERGIDIRGQRTKHHSAFAGEHFDFVVTVCDHAREECPDFAGAVRLHWSVPDPARDGADAGRYPAFERAADELAGRVEGFLPVLAVDRAS